MHLTSYLRTYYLLWMLLRKTLSSWRRKSCPTTFCMCKGKLCPRCRKNLETRLLSMHSDLFCKEQLIFPMITSTYLYILSPRKLAIQSSRNSLTRGFSCCSFPLNSRSRTPKLAVLPIKYKYPLALQVVLQASTGRYFRSALILNQNGFDLDRERSCYI